jgi:hypothetical protein
MRLPIRPLTGRWPSGLERRFGRFFWPDPRVILQTDISRDQFSRAMSAVCVGGTIKITSGNRHPIADQMLIDNVDLSNATIVDIGASDGSTSVDLIGRLPAFKKYIIADLHFYIRARQVGRRTVFYDNDGTTILVVGPRALGWPSTSRLVRLLYSGVDARARRSHSPVSPVLLLNPAARTLIDTDPRVSYQVHDVFTPWMGPRPTVVKVANLLRRLYFTDDVISSGLHAIAASLDEGGYLLIVDNVRMKGVPPRAGLYRRVEGRFRMVAETPDRPEIADLIDQVRVPAHPSPPLTDVDEDPTPVSQS